MNAKEYLMQYRFMWEDAYRLIAERAERVARAESASATIDGMPRGRGQHSDRVGSCAAAIADIDTQIAQTIEQTIDRRNALCALITCLPVREQETLYRWCLLGQTFSEIAENIQLTVRHVRRIHKKGLDLLQDMIEEKQNPASPCPI